MGVVLCKPTVMQNSAYLPATLATENIIKLWDIPQSDSKEMVSQCIFILHLPYYD